MDFELMAKETYISLFSLIKILESKNISISKEEMKNFRNQYREEALQELENIKEQQKATQDIFIASKFNYIKKKIEVEGLSSLTAEEKIFFLNMLKGIV